MADLTNPVKAIQAKCLDCCCGSAHEVKLCPCKDCSLYPFRFGKNPYRKKPNISPERAAQNLASLAKAHAVNADAKKRPKLGEENE